MATQVQFRRGDTATTQNFKGALGEVTVDTGKQACVVHDGSTTGGFPLLREDGANSAFAAGSLSSCALKFANDANTGIIWNSADNISLVTGGDARLTIDSSGTATFANNVAITGNLTINGTFDNSANLALIVALS